MNKNVLTLALIGIVGFLLYKLISQRPALPQSTTSSTTGGSQVSSGSDDVFTHLLGLISAGYKAATASAQTSPSTR